MGIFSKNPWGVKRQDLREALKKIPDVNAPGLKRISEKQKVGLEKEIFPEAKYGAQISLGEVKSKESELNRRMFSEKNYTKKLEAKREIEILKKLQK